MSNIVEIFAWDYKYNITFFPECFPGKRGEKIHVLLRDESKYFYIHYWKCNAWNSIIMKISASVDMYNEGRVEITYMDHNLTITKNINDDCKWWDYGGNYWTCNLSYIDPREYEQIIISK
uniref:S-protein homolog n=1 Tax=Strongyloides papillosus TaxID=174720 RepID=A0A0N5BJ94_STREA